MSNLRRDIANALGEHDELNITLCVRGGSQGRLTPLVTDLPDDEQTMEIVVFTTGSQGESLAVLSVVQQLLSVSLLMEGVHLIVLMRT